MVEIMLSYEYPERHNLLDPESRAKLPKLYATEETQMESQAIVKFISPDSNNIWYALEFDGEDELFGLVIGEEIEFGYISLYDLETAKMRLGISIERDINYEAKSLRELIELHRNERIKKAEE